MSAVRNSPWRESRFARSELTDQELMDRIFELQEEAGVAPMKTIAAEPSEPVPAASRPLLYPVR
jgi:hypothetical protein